MTSRSRILELAARIHGRTKEIDEFLCTNNLAKPSFAIDALPHLSLPKELCHAQDEILEASEELQALIAGPLPHLMRMTSPTINFYVSLQAIYRYQSASRLALDEELPFNVLASRCGLSESDIRRFLRMAIVNRVFQEPQKGVVAHNAISKLLVTIPLLDQWIGIVSEEMWPSACRTIDAMEKWPGSEDPAHTGFALASGIELPFFEAISKDTERARRFADAMEFLRSAPSFDISHLIHNLGWDRESLKSILLVDVGGSQGSVCMDLLRKFPYLNCIVEDHPEVISTAKIPPDLEGRLAFREHDFFTEQPVEGADVYFFRSVFHNWPDASAIEILRRLIPALKSGARIILNEVCLPDPGNIPFYQAQFLRGYDLAMKHNFNSKERDADECAHLLQASDSNFEVVSIKNRPQSMLSVIEVCWHGGKD